MVRKTFWELDGWTNVLLNSVGQNCPALVGSAFKARIPTSRRPMRLLRAAGTCNEFEPAAIPSHSEVATPFLCNQQHDRLPLIQRGSCRSLLGVIRAVSPATCETAALPHPLRRLQ